MSSPSLAPLKKYRVKVILAPICKLFECVFELFVPLLVKRVIDYLSTLPPEGGYDWKQILYPSLLILALSIFGFGATMITQYVASRVGADYAYDLRKELYHQIDRLGDGEVERYGKSKVLTLISSDSFALQTGVNMFMRLLIRAPFLIIGSIVACFLLSWQAGVIVLSALALSSVVVGLVMGLTPKRYGAIQGELDHISGLGEDALSGARPIRAFNRQEEDISSFQGASLSYEKKADSLARLNAVLNPLTFLFVDGAVILVLYLTGYRSSETGISAGTATAVLNYLAQALAALLAFSRLVTSLSKAAASKKRVDAFLSLKPSIVEGKEEGHPFQKGEEIFRLEKASLSYGGEELALKDIDFLLKGGERVGIIGGTGSGKSSLIALLERFQEASAGQVYYLGKPIQDYRFSSYRGEIALVSQKPQLYQGTVRSNILLGNPDASEEEITSALNDSLAMEFVGRYSDYLDHPIEESGANLSGGQKQRLLLCRALLSKRPILILDDATSALDYQSDLRVRQNIRSRGLTCILVSQRSTSLKDCDRIYVLDQGRLIAVGTHEELLSSCSIYREIYETQVAVK